MQFHIKSARRLPQVYAPASAGLDYALGVALTESSGLLLLT